jgi:ABC-type phosphate/phosphonate transport system substrate-binding protein
MSFLAAAENKAEPLTMVVMDPLAAPLACPCVKGYAQRDYEKLAAHLERQIGRAIKVHFAESLTNALQKKTGGRADIVIGKHSVVQSDAKANGLEFAPLASLSGKDGKTTQTGLFVVATADPAVTVADLKGYRILFGTEDCDEKFGAAMALLKDCEIVISKKPETCAACSDGATKIIDLHKEGVKAATVISSYAQPLLEGCGTIKKGDLRVIGETDAVPFVVAFANAKLPVPEREALQKALQSIGKNADLCTALETKHGFVSFQGTKKN